MSQHSEVQNITAVVAADLSALSQVGPHVVRLPRRAGAAKQRTPLPPPRGTVRREVLARSLQRLHPNASPPAPAAAPRPAPFHLVFPRLAEPAPAASQPPTALTAPPAPQGRDRRRFPRRTGAGCIAVCRHADQPTLTRERIDWVLHAARLRGQLVDISLSGAAFTLNQALTVGEELTVRGHCRDRRSIDLRLRVVRVIETADGEFQITGELQQRLGVDQVQMLSRQIHAGAVV